MPSVGSSTNSADSVVTAEKNWCVAVTPATVTVGQRGKYSLGGLTRSVILPVSVKTGPDADEPSPYWIVKLPLWDSLVEDNA